MEAMRSIWTDSRLDDFRRDVDSRFDTLNGRVDVLSIEVREMRGEIRDVRGEIGALSRTLIQVGGGMAGAILVGFMGLIATQL